MTTDVENLFGDSTESENESRVEVKKIKGADKPSVEYDLNLNKKVNVSPKSFHDDCVFNSSLSKKKQRVDKPKQSKSLRQDSISYNFSKRERLEILKAKRLITQNVTTTNDRSLLGPKKYHNEEYKGVISNIRDYDTDDSYHSFLMQRTEEDEKFIDHQDEDPEALKELYKEQNFRDDSPTDKYSRLGKQIKMYSGFRTKKNTIKGLDQPSDKDYKEDNNPIMIAMHKMRKKKKVVKKSHELELIAENFLTKMELATNEDEQLLKEKKPATRKLLMLTEVLEMLTKRDMMRPLLEADFLSVAGRWIKPLPDGSLGNVTLRQKLITSISKMNGEKGISSSDLKRSDFGKVVMSIYMHPDETIQMKRQLKSLIEKWSRPIFKKSENMRDLGRAYPMKRKNNTGLTGYLEKFKPTRPMDSKTIGIISLSKNIDNNLSSVISRKLRTSRNLGSNRVSVPFSKGFQYTIQPDNIYENIHEVRSLSTKIKSGRESLHIRMLEKSRSILRNQHSVNLSIEGRPIK